MTSEGRSSPGTPQRAQSRDEAEGVTMNSFVEFSEGSKVVPQRAVQLDKKLYDFKGVTLRSFPSHERASQKHKGICSSAETEVEKGRSSNNLRAGFYVAS